MEADRRKAVVQTCLDLFVEKGLYNTSTRDLSRALKLQSGGLYYYFQTKDDVVVACVEAAIQKLEEVLILPVLHECEKPSEMMKLLMIRADSIAPVYRFVVTVCSDNQYRERTKPILDELGKRYEVYTHMFAERLNCRAQEIAPFVYMGITAITNYMIFQEESFVAPQLKAVRLKLERILQVQDDREA